MINELKHGDRVTPDLNFRCPIYGHAVNGCDSYTVVRGEKYPDRLYIGSSCGNSKYYVQIYRPGRHDFTGLFSVVYDTKKMTVAEVSKALGHGVEIVEG